MLGSVRAQHEHEIFCAQRVHLGRSDRHRLETRPDCLDLERKGKVARPERPVQLDDVAVTGEGALTRGGPKGLLLFRREPV